MLTLFPDEQILIQSSEGSVTLTTHRICYQYKDWVQSYNQSIMLENITSCENYYNSQVWMLIAAGLCVVGGLTAAASNDMSLLSAALVIALALALLYWVTSRNFIIISSPSTQMVIKVTGMKKDQVLKFINNVEQARHKRILALGNRTNITR